jgi:hypothetical protein
MSVSDALVGALGSDPVLRTTIVAVAVLDRAAPQCEVRPGSALPTPVAALPAVAHEVNRCRQDRQVQAGFRVGRWTTGRRPGRGSRIAMRSYTGSRGRSQRSHGARASPRADQGGRR